MKDNGCNKCGNNNSNLEDKYKCIFFNNDIPCGFQDINPQLFTIIAQIVGDVISKDVPSNVQNSLGNWFCLVGQTLLTYNAQQQYFESGPGNVFNPINRNSSNPDCPGNNTESTSDIEDDASGKNKDSVEIKLDTLENEIKILKKEMKKLRGK